MLISKTPARHVWRKALSCVLSAMLLTACGGGGGGGGTSQPAPVPPPVPPPQTFQISGSVGDGPIVSATVRAHDGNGAQIAETTSDASAKYSMSLPNSAVFPITVSSAGGTDLVTNAAPTFALSSVLVGSSQTTVNVTPLSTLMVQMASCAGGGVSTATINNAASVLAQQFSTGLDSDQVANPISTPVTLSNVAEVVKANQVAAEIVDRATGLLVQAGRSLNATQVLRAIACDLSDGSLNGSGAAGSDTQVSALTTIAIGNVLLEAIQNELRVNGTVANARLDQAIRTIAPNAPSSENMASVAITAEVLRDTRRATAATIAVAPNAALVQLVQQLTAQTQDSTPAALAALISTAAETASTNAFANAPQLAANQLGQINQANGVTAVPTMNLTVNATSVTSGQTVQFTWTSSNATACAVSGALSAPLAANGTVTSNAIAANSTFDFTCAGAAGSVQQSISITVNTPNAPTVSISANPTTVASGGSSTLTWSSTNASACTATGGWTGSKAVSGTETISNITSGQTFTVTCTGAGGSANASANVSVANAPTVAITANPTTVASGGSSTLTWSSTNASACTAAGGWTGTKAVSGTQTISNITSGQTFTLTCTGAGGSANASASVAVANAPTVSITANPTTVASGGSSTLTWSSTNASACTAAGGWTGTKAVSGTQTISNITSGQTFTLTCTGTGGSANASSSVTVSSAPPPTLTLATSAATVNLGSSATLTWSSTNASSCSALGAWSGSKPVSGSESITGIAANGTYELTCTGSGGSVTRQVTINIAAPTVSLTVNPNPVAAGGSVDISWSATNATSCIATSPNWTGEKGPGPDTQSRTVSADSTYSLNCTGPGGSQSASVNVTVSTPQPVPTVNLTLSASSVPAGGTVTITWSSSNATSCTATSADTGFTGAVASSGSKTSTAINATRTYTLQCSNSAGNAITSSTVTVQSSSGPTLVSWTPPTTFTDGSPLTGLTGYKVYYGNAPGQYTQVLNVNDPFATSANITLTSGTWYVAVTALADVTDSSGTVNRESDKSAEVSTTIN